MLLFCHFRIFRMNYCKNFKSRIVDFFPRDSDSTSNVILIGHPIKRRKILLGILFLYLAERKTVASSLNAVVLDRFVKKERQKSLTKISGFPEKPAQVQTTYYCIQIIEKSVCLISNIILRRKTNKNLRKQNVKHEIQIHIDSKGRF